MVNKSTNSKSNVSRLLLSSVFVTGISFAIFSLINAMQLLINGEFSYLFAAIIAAASLGFIFLFGGLLIKQFIDAKKEPLEAINHNDQIHRAVNNKKMLNRLFVGVLLFLEIIILLGIIMVIFSDEWDNIYDIVSLALMLVWFGILTGYYAWAIYFYNINLGLTNHDWAEIRAKNQTVTEGTAHVPDSNPNADQTLGLPPGTVRGTVALTLLIGALAMAIAALGMKTELPENSFLIDHFDFFKTAFLMMIAFYFGNKSLEMIGYKNQKTMKHNQSIVVTPDNPSTINTPKPNTSAASELKKALIDDEPDTENSTKKSDTD